MALRTMRTAAAASLEKTNYDPKKLAAIHTGVALTVGLLMTVINFLIDGSISQTSGLSQLGNRAVLSTIQSVLSMAVMLALPFWEIGFLRAAMGMARSENVGLRDLTEGFRRMGPVARLYLLQFGLYLVVGFACMQVAGILFSFTPFLDSSLESMEAVLEQASTTGQVALTEADIAALLPALIPMYVIMLILFAVVAIPLFYRFRMASFAIMDDAPGARAAMAASARMMRGNRLSLFKVDLQFWWFYGTQLLIAVVAYADVILPAMGISLPVSADVMFFLTCVVHVVLQLLLAWQYSAHVQTTYAHCYDTLKNAAPPAPKPMPQDEPWDAR